MRTYIAFLTSAGLTSVGLAFAIVLHTGWEAAAAGLAVVAGVALLVSLAALLAMGDSPSGAGARAA